MPPSVDTITDARCGITTASTESIGTTQSGVVKIAGPGIIFDDPAGSLARNTAHHLLRVAIEVSTGSKPPVLPSTALMVTGGPAFHDHLETLRGPILYHTINP